MKFAPFLGIFLTSIHFAMGRIHYEYYLSVFGTLVSWVYLRFLKVHDGVRGDYSENFEFITFFPVIFQPCVKPFVWFLFKVFTLLNLIPISTNKKSQSSTQPIKREFKYFKKSDFDVERRWFFNFSLLK